MTSMALLTLALAFPGPELGEWYSLCAEGNWTAAAVEAADLLETDSLSVGALSALMVSAVYDGTEGAMTTPAKLAVALDPQSALAWTASGTILLARGEPFYEGAEAALLESARLDGGVAPCWFALGLLRERQGDLAGAMEYHRVALEVDPRFLPSMLQTARLLRGSGLPSQSLALLADMGGTESPAGRVALAERVILLDSLGRGPEADSIAAILCGAAPGVWLELAAHHLPGSPGRTREALLRAADCPGLVGMHAETARIMADLGDYEEACLEAGEALETGGDTILALAVLGESLLELGRHSDAEDAFQRLLGMGFTNAEVLNSLGWISELRAKTPEAVDYYLDALVLDPADPFARERLLIIADDSYDPYMWSSSAGGFSARGSVDLSVEHGNRERVNAGGSAALSWRITARGTSIDLGLGGRSVTWETDDGFVVEERQTDTGWATLSADYWFDDRLYLETGSNWDRQRFTARPWQVSSYLACGFQDWLAPWLRLSPELGLGYVKTKWVSRIREQITGRLTVYSAAALWFEKPHTFIQHAEISGELYIPPDAPGDFLSSGRISMAFRTWEPLYVSLGYEVDYTRVPEIATWKKFDTRFYTSLNFTLF